MPINKNQRNLLLARMSEAGLKSDRQKLDWLYEQGVNVNDLYDQLDQISNGKLNLLLAELKKK